MKDLNEDEVVAHLVGRRVILATTDTLTLSNGVRLRFATSNSDCCSGIDLERLNTTENIITAAKFGDNEEDTGGEGPYKAWIHVITEAGELNVAEADGDASSGYYLHGFALGVTLIEDGDEPFPAPAQAEIDAAINSIIGDS